MSDSDDAAQNPSRRNFMQGSLAGVVLGASGLTATPTAHAEAARSTLNHYHVPANSETVHWGYFSKKLKPVVEISSADFVTIETVTHHANDDAERMVRGDPGVESIFYWDKKRKGVNRRGAGPEDASLFGRGAGEGLGVHVCTGPVAVKGAVAGDILEVRIIDVKPRPSANAKFPGKTFGSNAAAWWGFVKKN
jgi:acetamidase/formamidase